MSTPGTPRTLDAAIENGMTLATQVNSTLIGHHVKDFLSQHFTTALVSNADKPEVEKALQALWERITRKGEGA